jgi:PadR family transcriptional regulator AphA
VTSSPRSLSLSDWAVLALVAEGPTHGWPIVRTLAPSGPLGEIWTVPRAVVYRSITLLRSEGLIEERSHAPGVRGPERVVFRATPQGRRRLRRWLETPVDHVRDIRTELLLKLALIDRAGRSFGPLVERQLAQLAPVFEAQRKEQPSGGFDVVLARWRREHAMANETFLRGLLEDAAMTETRSRRSP